MRYGFLFQAPAMKVACLAWALAGVAVAPTKAQVVLEKPPPAKPMSKIDEQRGCVVATEAAPVILAAARRMAGSGDPSLKEIYLSFRGGPGLVGKYVEAEDFGEYAPKPPQLGRALVAKWRTTDAPSITTCVGFKRAASLTGEVVENPPPRPYPPDWNTINLSLPVVSADGRYAIMFLSTGQGRVGIAGAVLLAKVGGRWREAATPMPMTGHG